MNTIKYTLITGASSGLGKELAVQCARMGRNVILIALPNSNIFSLAKDISLEYRVKAQPFEFDMTNSREMDWHLDFIIDNFEIDFLINNAGVGGSSSILETTGASIDKIIQLNIRSTAMLTHRVLPSLVRNEQSYIMNISSMAAFTPIAYKTVYPASKAFISSFSLGLKEELQDKGVSVSVVYPGPMMTNSNTTRRIISQGMKGKMGLLSATDIAAIALKKTMQRQSVIIPGWSNRVSRWAMAMLPMKLKLKIVSGEVKKEIRFSPAI